MITDWITTHARLLADFVRQPSFLTGLCLGAGIVLFLMVLISIVRYRRRRCTAIVVDTEQGYFKISLSALKTFVSHEIEALPGLKFISLHPRQRGDQVALNIKLAARGGQSLPDIADRLRQRLIRAADKKFGIGNRISAINFSLESLQIAMGEELGGSEPEEDAGAPLASPSSSPEPEPLPIPQATDAETIPAGDE